ncbi:MAG: class I SAM-dependent RNA methyltransferase [Eubacteriales bacterium]|nr:class I SAM-dependent RNA methyltransferase [Clostridiales bacterium]MDY5836652.1 class I SAM-dependent RNA methyltransferase [Eubacteriales bacterium]
MEYKIFIPVLMGLESCVSDELEALGFAPDRIHKEDARVLVDLDQDRASVSRAVALCNIHLRTAERVELEVCRFKARDFDSLFDQAQDLAWEDYIEPRAAITVKGYSRKSQLFAPSAIQSTLKKAIVLRLQKARRLKPGSQLPEDRNFRDRRVNYSIMRDEVSLRIDTSGAGLHKRAYRLAHTAAPIKETLAAGLIMLSRFAPFSGEMLYDPTAGSGTFVIEAALMAANIAPGARRTFSGEAWAFLDSSAFAEAKEEALAQEDRESMSEIFLVGSDLDPQAVKIARENAKRAGVAQLVDFQRKDLFALDADQLKADFGQDRILFISNPPYGERLADSAMAQKLHQGLGQLAFYPGSNFTRPGCRLTVITPGDFETDTGHKADKRRKLYNGMIPCTMYHYFREKYLEY